MTSENIQNELITMFNEILDTQVCETDNFVEAGGDSLFIISLISKIERKFKITLSFDDIFLEGSPKELANKILQSINKI
jgi:acyl carrier protein